MFSSLLKVGAPCLDFCASFEVHAEPGLWFQNFLLTEDAVGFNI